MLKAEREENLKVCSTGQYPALCKHDLLSPSELDKVRQAERRENLRICTTGKYKALCNHALLTPEQARTVSAAEAQAATTNSSASSGQETAKAPSRAGTCQTGLSIVSVEADGKVIGLDDGTLWKVDDVDTVTSSIWLPATEVVVCGNKIIDTDDNESVEAVPLGQNSARGSRSAPSGYEIQASANDETFVINGEMFTAKTYCFNFDQGDRVTFIDGSPTGV